MLGPGEQPAHRIVGGVQPRRTCPRLCVTVVPEHDRIGKREEDVAVEGIPGQRRQQGVAQAGFRVLQQRTLEEIVHQPSPLGPRRLGRCDHHLEGGVRGECLDRGGDHRGFAAADFQEGGPGIGDQRADQRGGQPAFSTAGHSTRDPSFSR